MTKNNNGKRGFLLVVAALVMLVLSVLTAIYLSTIVGEKRSVDTERTVFQALNFAEGGANKVFAQLRSAIQTSLAGFDSASKNQQDTSLAAYAGNSLLLFSTSGVTVNATCATVTVNDAASSEFLSPVSGAVNATATILPAERVRVVNGVYYFENYTYQVDSDARINYGNQVLHRNVVFAPAKFSVTARRTNFAKYALFTFHHTTPAGTTVWFTGDTNFYGPVHTNDRFSFANNPGAHFTNDVTQHQGTARFYNNGNSILLDNDHNGVRDVPTFDATFTRSQDTIPLPAAVSQTDLRNAALGTMSVPGSSSPGVYVPNSGGALTGGIFLNGSTGDSSDNIGITMSVDGSNNPVYSFTQDIVSHHHTTTHTYSVTVNLGSNTTTVVRDGVSTTYTGKPDGNTHEGIIIYATDDIKSLAGTVQRNTDMTVSGERDIVITDDVTYQDYNTSPSLNAEGYDNMLGILSWAGNVRVATTAPDDINIHAVVMAPHGVFTVDNYDSGSSRGTATLLGGVISDYYGAFGTFSGTSGMRTGYGRNFVYDARVLAGKAPPYFPYLDKYAFDQIPTLSSKPVWKEGE